MPRDVAREPGRCGPKQLIKVDIFSLECGEKRERERGDKEETKRRLRGKTEWLSSGLHDGS